MAAKRKPAHRRLRRTRRKQGILAGSKQFVTGNSFITCRGSGNGRNENTRTNGSAKGRAAGRKPVLTSFFLSRMKITE
jgi:hypothetical protein